MKKYTMDMLAPRRDYRDADGNKLPGVTTILGVLDKPQLILWAAKEERSFMLDAPADACEAARALRDAGDRDWHKALGPLAYAAKRDKAADIGTVAHARIEAWVRDMELEQGDISDGVWASSNGPLVRFVAWWKAYALKLEASELQIVSTNGGYGGTVDLVASDPEGGRWLVDIKTSNPSKYFPYPAYIAQAAAYEELLQETFDNVAIVRVGKDDGSMEECFLSVAQRRSGLALFHAARNAYVALKEL